MKTVVLIDSFKGSMSSIEAGNAAKEGILKANPKAEVLVLPLADGGEGTTDALIEGMGGKRVAIRVTGPMGQATNAYYGILEDGKTAVMEMAQAAGITLVNANHKDPYRATTYGVGEMIQDAIEKGCRKFVIGIGGSATNDGGMGMLQALGVKFLTEDGKEVGRGINALSHVASISTKNMLPELKKCEFNIACDVNNPLCGKNGATYIYGAQKGVQESKMAAVDEAMKHYARMTAIKVGRNFANESGAGAAGGMGFAFVSYLGAKLVPGIELILDVIKFRKHVKNADIVVTGEGRLDLQTAMGKAPVGVAKVAKEYNCKVIAFAGGVTKEAIACNNEGIDAFFPIVRGVCTLKEAMDNKTARENLTDTATQVFRLL